MWPPAAAVEAGPAPSKGTSVMSVPAALASRRISAQSSPPVPLWPRLTLPGLALM
jgi:hypothetical protein